MSVFLLQLGEKNSSLICRANEQMYFIWWQHHYRKNNVKKVWVIFDQGLNFKVKPNLWSVKSFLQLHPIG